MSETIVRFQPSDVSARLLELGLPSAEVLLEAVVAGDAKRRAIGKLHPSWYPGMAQNAETVACLRELLIPQRWHSKRRNNLELVESPDRSLGIAVASGDAGTGDEVSGRKPHSRYPKGAATIVVVLQNNTTGQHTFPWGDRVLTAGSVKVRRPTWFLLVYSTGSEVRYELSLPKAISKADRRIVDWHERIVFPAISRDHVPNIARAEDQNDIDVYVKARAN